jgi:hypothetical protein
MLKKEEEKQANLKQFHEKFFDISTEKTQVLTTFFVTVYV